MRNIKIVLISFLMVLLAGCSHLSDGNRISTPSRDKRNIATLRVPPNLSISYDTLYPIPPRNYAKVSQVDITPPTLNPNAADVGSGWFSWY